MDTAHVHEFVLDDTFEMFRVIQYKEWYCAVGICACGERKLLEVDFLTFRKYERALEHKDKVILDPAKR
jgi:hypothetical protein